MITLPDNIVPNDFQFRVVDLGFVQEGVAGLGDRIDRQGNHFACQVDYPPLRPDVARAFVAKMTRAVRLGLRVKIPLLGVSQGYPGDPVVDGDEPAGTSLPLRGVTPGYAAKVGYWLTIVRAADDYRATHLVQTPAVAGEDGTLILDVDPPIRAVFADGDTVLLAKPTIEGVMSAPSWMLTTDRVVRLGATLTIEEVA